MNQTENEYADSLIKMYNDKISNTEIYWADEISVECAVIDVNNTIDLINTMPNDIALHYNKYYETVLQILKDKL